MFSIISMEEEGRGVLQLKDGNYGMYTTNGAVVKGKQTKRLRLPSAFVFEVNNNNNDNNNNDDDVFEDDNYCPSMGGDRASNREKADDGVKEMVFPGPSLERIEENVVGMDREEVDMARCLILLAQGRSRDFRKEVDNYRYRSSYDWRESIDQEDQKFSSKRYREATTGTGKIGYYVYECKTCNRTFPSFQALGGHRASYKKPKVVVAAAELKRQFVPPPLMLDDDDEASATQFTRDGTGNGSLVTSPLSVQLTSSLNSYRIGSKSSSNNNRKVYKCAICSAEFSSGQALGGHMRWHRAPAGASPGFSLSSVVTPPDSEGPRMRVRTLVSLDLDLNLPAPEAAVDNNVNETSKDPPVAVPQPKQQEGQQQDQPLQPLVFSVPALVDYHY